MHFPYKTADIAQKPFGTTRNGEAVGMFYLTNRKGFRAEIAQLDTTICRLSIVGGDMRKHDVALGAKSLNGIEQGDFLRAAARGVGIPDPRIAQPRIEQRHLVLAAIFGEGEPDETVVETRFAMTENDEFVIGRSVRTTQNAIEKLEEDSLRQALMAAMTPLYLNLAGQKPGNVLDHAVSVDAKRCLNLTAIEPESEPLSALMDATHSQARDIAEFDMNFRDGRVLSDKILLPECFGGETNGFDALYWVNRKTSKEKTAESACAAPEACASAYCARSRTFLSVATDAPLIRLTTFQPPKGQPVTCEGVSYGNHSGFALQAIPNMEMLQQTGHVEWTEAYRFTPDFPDCYHPDSGCLNRFL
ncbi:hypothetical protein [Slackia isoflavoniconvertens]|uniref:hypothetical protein n=1 Tax=Slackia isoflavoniconvertens TaxID=572010 RepID=UPI002E79F644|nr:hypothetical protein [Slackia isoflavoniconvertens]